MHITIKRRPSWNLVTLHQILTDFWPLFYLDFGKNYHVQIITHERIAGSQIIFCTYVYNHKRKVKFESGHTPPKSDRVMAPFLLRIWENKPCPDDNSWKDWWNQMVFVTCVYITMKRMSNLNPVTLNKLFAQ